MPSWPSSSPRGNDRRIGSSGTAQKEPVCVVTRGTGPSYSTRPASSTRRPRRRFLHVVDDPGERCIPGQSRGSAVDQSQAAALRGAQERGLRVARGERRISAAEAAMVGLVRMAASMVKSVSAGAGTSWLPLRERGRHGFLLEMLVFQPEPTRVVWLMIPRAILRSAPSGAPRPQGRATDRDGGNSTSATPGAATIWLPEGHPFVAPPLGGLGVEVAIASGRRGRRGCSGVDRLPDAGPKDGYAAWPVGAGHFLKMVHTDRYGLCRVCRGLRVIDRPSRPRLPRSPASGVRSFVVCFRSLVAAFEKEARTSQDRVYRVDRARGAGLSPRLSPRTFVP